MPQQSAVDVLKRYIHSNRFTPGFIYIAGKPVAALDISDDEVAVLGQELDSIVDWDAAPRIAGIIVRGAPRILDAVRAVNRETKAGYGGAAGRGQQLVVQKMTITDLLRFNPSSTAVETYPMTTWLRSLTATGATQWSGTSTYNNTMVVNSLPYIAHVFLGFFDPIEIPKCNRIQLIKEGDPMAVEVLEFNMRQGFGDYVTPVHELLQPWVIAPAMKYYIAINYYITGDDKLEPIGFTVKRAADIIAALA